MTKEEYKSTMGIALEMKVSGKSKVDEARSSTGRKIWKQKVENINMEIINDDSFDKLNKYYSMYNDIDRS